ncbi:MAG: serine/threonine protein kinase [Planctomycetes bacterium]|nr:serine/threonine protein kinase [Planctomycetota bacterium]MBI3847691.1 serine/threonine protein kinase [Planctomycetota bacterium]
MTPERWHQARELLETALDRPAGERTALVSEACGQDDELRRTVEDLLARADEDALDFMEPPLPDAAHALVAHVVADDRVGAIVGRYRLLSVIAVGGMGTVYRAVRTDGDDDRAVALKLVRPGMGTDDMRRRFHRERRLLANLDHPSITRLLDGGTSDDGAPYLVMELVEGEAIDRYCNDRGLSIEARLALFRRICAAVHFAHQNLVVHRDLKPSNVLVTKSGDPKLLDFGIAKLLAPGTGDRAGDATLTAALAMTPEYSSPEQIRGEPITTSSDVYALGVILYELLAGQRPYRFEPARRFDAERIVCEVDAPKPSTVARPADVRRRLRGDLDTIVAKAMSKDPQRRYASADELSADVERFLDGAPILAHPPSRAYVVAKFVRRHRVGACLAALILLLVAGFAVTATLLASRLDRERRDAVAARESESGARRDAERVSAFMQDLLASASPNRNGGDFTVLELLGDAGERVEREFGNQPAVAAGLHLTIAKTYISLWLSRRAEPHLRQAIALYASLGETRYPEMLDAIGQLGIVLGYQDQEEGLDVVREGTNLARSLYGSEDRRTTFLLHVLAFDLFRCAHPPRFEESEAAFAELLPLQRRLYGDGHYAVGRVLHTQAALRRREGRLENADALYREALAIFRRTVGDENLMTIECLADYADFLGEQQRFDAAVESMQEALALTRRRLGERWTAPLLGRLANLRRRAGDLDEAESLYRRALVLQLKSSAARDFDAAERVGEDLRDLPDGHSEYATFVRLWRGVGRDEPSDSLDFASLLGGLGDVLIAKGDPDAANPLLREVLRIVAEAYPHGHWRVAMAKCRLGACLAAEGRGPEAERLVTDACRVVCAALGEHASAAHEAMAQLAEVRRLAVLR